LRENQKKKKKKRKEGKKNKVKEDCVCRDKKMSKKLSPMSLKRQDIESMNMKLCFKKNIQGM
jgi:hypothetical protein